MSPSVVEGHIDDVHPHSGIQHLRIAHDPQVEYDQFGGVVTAKFPRNEDVIPQPDAPITFSFDIAVNCCLEWFIFVQSREQGLVTTAIWFLTEIDTDFILVGDDRTGTFEWHIEHHRAPDGIYQRLSITVDPCQDSIQMHLGGNLFYFHPLWNASNADQIIFSGDNGLTVLDIDNFEVVTGEPCPVFGACCDTNSAGQGCTEGVLEADCNGDDKVFHANLTCGEITCECSPNCVDRVCGPDGCGGFCGNCSNGDVCDGVESCNASGQCDPGVPLDCDDGLYCNGAEMCHSVAGCQPGAGPCLDGETCNEADDSCQPPVPPTIPAAGAWGLLAFTLLLLIASKLRFRRRTFA